MGCVHRTISRPYARLTRPGGTTLYLRARLRVPSQLWFRSSYATDPTSSEICTDLASVRYEDASEDPAAFRAGEPVAPQSKPRITVVDW